MSKWSIAHQRVGNGLEIAKTKQDEEDREVARLFASVLSQLLREVWGRGVEAAERFWRRRERQAVGRGHRSGHGQVLPKLSTSQASVPGIPRIDINVDMSMVILLRIDIFNLISYSCYFYLL